MLLASLGIDDPEAVFKTASLDQIANIGQNFQRLARSGRALRDNPGEVSDGYHTFNELYEHRCVLFIALLKCEARTGWISKLHHDGSSFDGWFVAGLRLPTGNVTYHLPNSMWETAVAANVWVRDRAPEWDGHTSADVVTRLREWIEARLD
jgi:hypothetical protein